VEKNSLPSKGKHFLKRFVPASVVQAQLHRRVIMQFADKVGLVYFGYVDQRTDEHKLVRGLTLSASHRDNHYCIGTFDGYDVALVERRDTIRFPGKASKVHNWLIMTFDLHTSRDIPHIFVGLHNHSETFYAHLFTKFSQLSKIDLNSYGAYSSSFKNRYSVYSAPDQTHAATSLIDPIVAQPIGDHFGSITFEISENSLYLYAEDQRTTGPLLEKMLKYGIWLAQTIDSRMNPRESQED
jgi:hypothetical protein